jgi:hypothetical protein
MELRNFHLFPILCFSVLCHCQRLDFLLQHRYDNAVDRDYLGIDLWMARGVLAIFRARGFDEA